MNRKKIISDKLISTIDGLDNDKLIILSIGPGNIFYEELIFQKYRNRINKFILSDIININHPKYYDFYLYKDLDKSLKYDLVIVIDVIEHVQDLLEFSNNLINMSKGGRLFLGTPNLHRIYNIFLILLNKLSFPKSMGNGWQKLGFSKEADTHNFELTKEILVSLFNSKNNIELNEIYFSKLSSLLNRSDYLVLT